MSGTGVFNFVSSKEFVCVRKLCINDNSQKIEKRKKMYYTFKGALHIVIKYEYIIENLDI